MLKFNRSWPLKANVHFIHNWRCAGTTVNSLLSSNFHQSYLKIGHPFTNFGWPEPYDTHRAPLQSKSQLKSALGALRYSSKAAIVGGHTFYGLERFLPGPWDIWMNYRDPLTRLNSGILRFYSKKFKSKPSSHGHLIDLEGNPEINLDDPHSVDLLLETTLLRESNGISRRLAAITTSDYFHISNDDNLEVVDIIASRRYSAKDLYDNAVSNLDAIDILINSDYFHHSILALERFYSLKSPIINPFSNLSHNSVELVGVKKTDKRLYQSSNDILLKHTAVDRKLLPLLNAKFAHQINNSSISEEDVSLRQLIHHKPILDQRWFDVNGTPVVEDIEKLIVDRIVKCSQRAKSLANKMFDIVLEWDGFEASSIDSLYKYKIDRYGHDIS